MIPHFPAALKAFAAHVADPQRRDADGAAATPAVVLVRVFAALTEVEVWHISMLQYYHH